MCGLIAILDWKAGGWSSSLAATKAVDRGLKRMSYRGLPGRSLIIQEGNTIIGHTRLPIISMDEAYDQPMLINGTIGAFVGEIFNYKEINKSPPEGAYYVNFNYPPESDTETLIKTFTDLGLDGFHQFDGFWAAIFVRNKVTTVVTDYLSQKPLYFHKQSLLVASEPAAILAALNLNDPLHTDEIYLSNVLKWGYSPDHRTPWEAIKQLPAGVALTYPPGPEITPYWDWDEVPARGDIRDILIEAVKNRLVGDRDVAILLSGGLDSTIIYEILTKELKQVVHPYYVVNGEDEEYINHVTKDYFSLKPNIVSVGEALKAHQVPVDLGSMVPQLSLAKELNARGYYVAMSGDGADELFGGYRRAQEYDSQMSDTFIELSFYHLPRLDRLMMNQTVELRCPFLAPKVVKYAMSVPWARRTEKQVLKEAFKDLVPEKILNRPKHPLKAPAVVSGGVKYRQELIDLWKEMQ
jgi:asparagine synthase (glutamine-hydrolysing)